MSLRSFSSDRQIVVLDPTCAVWKNVTPNCYRIEEVLNLFKRAAAGIDQLKDRIAQCFGGDVGQLNQASMNSLVAMKMDEWYGDQANVVAGLFGFKTRI